MKTTKIHIRHILLCSALLCTFTARAQVRAREYNASAMPSNSIVYALPDTKICILVSMEQTQETPGEFWQYAQRYLGVSAPISKERTSYKLSSVTLGTHGIPSDSLQYSVQFKRNSSATNMTLADNNLIIAVNAPGTQPEQLPTETKWKRSKDQRFTELSSMPPAYIQATSPGKKAEIAAEEIYRLRESRTAIISGESDQPFPDGNAMEIAIKGLDSNEKSLTERFIGHKDTQDISTLVLNIDPTVEGRSVAFRFSESEGLLPADDLRGDPVYLSIKVTNQAPILDERDLKKKERQLKDGLVYRVPGEVEAQLTDHRGNVLTTKTLPIAQFGTLEALESDLFTNDKVVTSVTFHQSTGAIKAVNSTTR